MVLKMLMVNGVDDDDDDDDGDGYNGDDASADDGDDGADDGTDGRPPSVQKTSRPSLAVDSRGLSGCCGLDTDEYRKCLIVTNSCWQVFIFLKVYT